MSFNFKVDELSNAELKQLACQALDNYKTSPNVVPDIVAILGREYVFTRAGTKSLRLSVLDDTLMVDDEAHTICASDLVEIRVRRTVYEGAKFGVGRARMTLAHELAHAVLHNKPMMARKVIEPKLAFYLKSSQSSEQQAKAFAAYFLMRDELIRGLRDAKEIAVHCLVSETAAKIRLDETLLSEAKRLNAIKLRQLAEELRSSESRDEKSAHYLNDQCTSCGQQKLSVIGVKVLCDGCGFMGDGFQDGDQLSS